MSTLVAGRTLPRNSGMSGHFHGRHHKGYMRVVRDVKRAEAAERASKRETELILSDPETMAAVAEGESDA